MTDWNTKARHLFDFCHSPALTNEESRRRISAALAAAFQEGQREGIERSAKECDKIASNTKDHDSWHRRAAGQCGFMVRALSPGTEESK